MRRVYHVAVACAALFGLGACAAAPAYRTTDVSGPDASTDLLNPGMAVLVAVPVDGVYNHRIYAGSGLDVAQTAATAFSRYATRVKVASDTMQERQELLVAARRANAGYLIVPTIIHWEPRATAWTGIPAQVDIELAVTSVETGHEIRSTVLEGRSTPASSSESTPLSMYSVLVAKHVAALYGTEATSSKP